MSNYFARYSPDGKWIVFCKAKTFMLLQADSELYIMPSGGGEPRRLRANRAGGMNSWHSWSPNGKWLVFSSKVFSRYTQLFLTHIDSEGNSSPPVLLSRFTSADRAANIPEFVRARPDAIQEIRERFLSENTYTRLAHTNNAYGDLPGAEAASRKAVALNPHSAEALNSLGLALARQGKVDESQQLFNEALREDPKSTDAHMNTATNLRKKGQLDEALKHYQTALAIAPGDFEVRLRLGTFLVSRGQLVEAVEHLQAAVRINPTDAEAHYALGLAFYRQEKHEEALKELARALEQDASYADALVIKAAIRGSSPKPDLRDAAEALQLARRACELTKFTDPEALFVLAMAYSGLGQRSEAIMAATRAAEVARRNGREAFARSIEERFRN
jgi:tetratricopeptide (TPR) repeat protein